MKPASAKSIFEFVLRYPYLWTLVALFFAMQFVLLAQIQSTSLLAHLVSGVSFVLAVFVVFSGLSTMFVISSVDSEKPLIRSFYLHAAPYAACLVGVGIMYVLFLNDVLQFDNFQVRVAITIGLGGIFVYSTTMNYLAARMLKKLTSSKGRHNASLLLSFLSFQYSAIGVFYISKWHEPRAQQDRASVS